MSRKTENKNRSRMSPDHIENILNDLRGQQPVASIECEDPEFDIYDPKVDLEEGESGPGIPSARRITMRNEFEYDSLHPEKTIQAFSSYIRRCLSRYEENADQLTACEKEIQDIMHYMEMGQNKKWSEGYKLYKQLTAARRERRRCKNEIELLHPVYELFHATKLLDQLGQIQGKCRTVKEAIDGRVYYARTDVLNGIVNQEDEES